MEVADSDDKVLQMKLSSQSSHLFTSDNMLHEYIISNLHLPTVFVNWNECRPLNTVYDINATLLHNGNRLSDL